MQELKFYRIQTPTRSDASLVPASMKLKKLYEQVKQKQNSLFTIFYHWKPLQIQKYGDCTLNEIVEEDPVQKSESPTFYICHETSTDQNQVKEIYGEDFHKYIRNQDLEEPKKIWKGQNGHVLYDDRNAAILASSTDQAVRKHEDITDKKEFKRIFKDVMSNPQKEILVQEKPSLFTRILRKLHLVSSKPNKSSIIAPVVSLQNSSTIDHLKSHHESTQYSDYDPRFVTYLESVYVKFAILSAFKLHYVEYKGKMDFGVVKRQFSAQKIGIIGDFGTGLDDSINLLKHMILVQKVDIIIHLGDVYYAGTPEEYKKNILQPLNKLRTQVNKPIPFYSIPGNHDYYSWGLPYLTFLSEVNSFDEFTAQEASYFCLRSQNKKWQFLGLDTAYHDSNPLKEVESWAMGPYLRQDQLEWAKDKIQGFPGSTILLTHHQLFSIHDRICGARTNYHKFTLLNPLLSAQFFGCQSKISSWFWGHQHSFMMFHSNILGFQKNRLLGNSSFHVFSEQNPYNRKQGFPIIPLVEDDESYKKKYLPTAPNQAKEVFFNLCYGVIDFSTNKENLWIDYYCCPCYNDDQKEKKYFQPYLLYGEQIRSRKEIEKEKIKQVRIGENIELYIKSEVGLLISGGSELDLSGKTFKIQKITPGDDQLRSDDMIVIKAETKSILEGEWRIKKVDKSTNFNPYEPKKNNTVFLNQNQAKVCFYEPFILQNLHKQGYLCVKIEQSGPCLKLENRATKFMFLNESLIKI